MKRCNSKILFLLITMILTTILLGGCSKPKAETSMEYVYVPSQKKFEFNPNYLVKTIEKDNYLYILGSIYDEESSSQTTSLVKYDLKTNQVQELNIPLDDSSTVAQMIFNSEGNLLIAAYRLNIQEGSIDGVDLIEASSTNGSITRMEDISDCFESLDSLYIQYFCQDKKGNCYISDGNGKIIVLDQKFTSKTSIAANNYIKSMETSKEGDVYIVSYGNEGIDLLRVDIDANALVKSEKIQLGVGDKNIYTSSQSSFLLGDSTTLSKFDLSTGQKEELLQWLEVDIDSSKVAFLGQLADGNIWVIYMSEGLHIDNQYELILLSREKSSQVAMKETIYYGTLHLDDVAKNNIVNFNKSNDKYRILVKDYGQYDRKEGIEQLNADILSDNGPDIIDLANIDFLQYAQKGILEDLNPYMEKSGIKKEDYLENVFACYNFDGKQYGIVQQFSLDTIIAKASKLKNQTGWNLDEMIQFIDKEKIVNAFSNEDRQMLIDTCLSNNLDEFINWETGECTFKDDYFKRVLEFVAGFPKEAEYSQEDNIATRVQADQVLLINVDIDSSFTNQLMQKVFDEDITYIGYPDKDRNGSKINPSFGSCAIASESKHKDIAWSFLEYTISQEVQNQIADGMNHWGFPSNKAALERYFENEMKPFEDSVSYMGSVDGYQYEISPSRQEDVDALRELIKSSVGVTSNSEASIMQIISEESGAYFEGQKTVDDITEIIQNRVQTYVNENR